MTDEKKKELIDLIDRIQKNLDESKKDLRILEEIFRRYGIHRV